MATFMDRFLDSRYRKRQRPEPPLVLVPQMSFLAPPKAPQRKISQRLLRPSNETDEFLSSDLEVSFASTVSLHSPPRDVVDLSADSSFMDSSFNEAMDISPAPRGRYAPMDKGYSRPRAYTSSGRLFGSDISNSKDLPTPTLAPTITAKTNSTQAALKKTQRSALPTEWMDNTHPTEVSQDNIFAPSRETPAYQADEDAMDVDTSYIMDDSSQVYSQSDAPSEFNHLFYGTTSPRRSLDSPAGHQSKKRRSLSPEPVRLTLHQNSSSPMLSSPAKEEFTSAPIATRSNKPSLQGLGAPTANMHRKPRRPVVSALPSSDMREIHSAYPAMGGEQKKDHQQLLRIKGAAPVRRAFSALMHSSNIQEPYSEESSFDGPDMSSPAQAYTKRQQVRTLRRCDGTEDLRPLAASPIAPLTVRDSPSSRYFAPGLGGFGDNEAHGKILPCHRVREDGLMRIKPATLDQLLDGVYNEKITSYHIIDCRFDYEYHGGHIRGAININTTAAVEELLLGSNLSKPKPSTSGDSVKKTILVFHCEFSAKRAPTFAKHLRAKDRAMNNHIYPKIHYPEVYILEGGYCQYFKASKSRCEPQAYVTMDDPTHALSRREDLDQFRKAKFGRHKSYAFGDTAKSSSQQQQSKRSAVPNPPSSAFLVAPNARTRRGGSGATLCTLPEDGNTTLEADETDIDIGDSPCPPPSKNVAMKSKKLGRASLSRADTYGPVRMPY
ncbi:hypothetical protein AX16_004199 [Volvariella volvacea WC 439]|nr:hypothetical protein AX16_004199 [Volvariella volvacea WC 439]